MTNKFPHQVVLGLLAACLFHPAAARAQRQAIVWSGQEKPILAQLRTLRSLADDQRAAAEKQLAIEIRALPAVPNKELLANSLANLVTEGDPGQETLQEVATTLAQALHDSPPAGDPARAGQAWLTLAQLVRYEHVRVAPETAGLTAAVAKLEAADKIRQDANFTLTDLDGKAWTLKDLRGKVVVVNFWATWCPPCRKEMPDLDALYRRFQDKGLIVLAISDEEAGKVRPFLADHKVSYPILLDPGRKVNELFQVEGIPKTFVYDREGRLAAEAIDMRTQRQFLAMLARAGLE